MKFNLNAPNPIAPFRRIPAGRILETTLKERLPFSSHVYNMMIMSSGPGSGINFYTLNGLNCPSCWIVTTFLRVDKGMEYSISAPLDPEITPEVRQAFETSALFDWEEKSYLFVGVDSRISPMIYEISILQKNRDTLITPCVTYWMDEEDASLLDTSPLNSDVVVQRVNSEEGVNLLVSSWKHAKPGSELYLRELVERDGHPSAAVYVHGVIVSGVILKSHGAFGVLYTKEGERGKGYGALCLKNVIKLMADNSLVPCCHVESRNSVSRAFHERFGLKMSHICHFIFVT